MHLNKTIDINECLVDDGGCVGLKKCVNTIGGHECQCILGYTENGGGCIGTLFLINSSILKTFF